MSIVTMLRACEYCGRRYTYDPSVGRFGMVCPHCGKLQKETVPSPINEQGSVIDKIFMMFSKERKRV